MFNRKRIWTTIFACAIFGNFGLKTIAQESIKLTVGCDLPEMLNLGLRIQSEQGQIGLSIGSVPIQDESLLTIAGTVYYHFGGQARFNDHRPWYGRSGICYLQEYTETIKEQYLYLDLRVGHELNFSRKVGLNLDAGVIFQIYHHRERIKPNSSWFNFDFDFPILPAVGFDLFYRMK